ncbi:MAG: CPBP family intramembrane metalloprotease [Geminocystis sp.]|nr:CPBP family intramembrane metalloprotease [Geminocystis sp.]HIK37567.1 CPBP family intramembrane metalloprotease [Geminocystis sp. M7585_C2015_104]MCS7146722.1 CPBP family intramembrane metalloprotease [Geminocystis sp.]MCX8077128.1 CPBP family intramembrane metalloprotease [Geminocystis sp.]MDW8115548.1 type II CAAX endopeptidase family protein [Geminocystis sp.]
MTGKRLLLIILTVVSAVSVFLTLFQSLGEIQIQYQLELYQSNLILNASQWQPKGEKNAELLETLIGNTPYKTIAQQYEQVLEVIKDNIQKKNQTISQLDATRPRQQLKQSIQQDNLLLERLNICLAILYAYQNDIQNADKYLSSISDERIRGIIGSIWLENKGIKEGQSEEVAEIISQKLDGWFENVTLARLYQLTNDKDKLVGVQNEVQSSAEKALIKLGIISSIAIFGGLIGFGLIIFLLIESLLKKENSTLAINSDKPWETPWDWEVILQVIVGGFFFFSQVVLPIILGGLRINPADFDIRGKALYVFFGYLLMAGGGLAILYLSLKPFFPLPKDWFNFTGKNWFWWGIGGYVTAIPLVFFVSLLNQQLWQGRGGSNPLLFLALEAQDKFALAVFFVTASIAAPIFEEIMFRGFLLPSLTRYYSVGDSILFSAFIFAIAHGSLAEAIPLASLGLILGIVYTRSRSLLASIMVHSLWNSATLLTLFLLGSK